MGSDPSRPARWRQALLLCTAGIALFGGLMALFPFGSDAFYASWDPLFHARNAEERPRTSISGHHPLFHVSAGILTRAMARLGVQGPGGVAVTILSALGAAALALFLLISSGPRRGAAAIAIAFPLLASRAFLFEGATGETVPLGVMAAVAVLLAAAHPRVPGFLVCLSLVMALMLRQDNVLVVPAAALAFFTRMPKGQRVGSTAALLTATGVLTIAAYGLLWWFTVLGLGLSDWLFGLSVKDGVPLNPFAEQPWGWTRMEIQIRSLGNLFLGSQDYSQWFSRGTAQWLRIWSGPSLLGIVLIGSTTLAGTRPPWRLIAACLVGSACWILFYLWFEPGNFEWWLAPLSLLTLAACSLARGEPRFPRWLRCTGGTLLIAVSLLCLVAHGPSMWSLRETRLRPATQVALEAARRHPGCLVSACGSRAFLALDLEGVDVTTQLPPRWTVDATAIAMLQAEACDRPLLVFFDRDLHGAGMPATRDRPGPLDALDTHSFPPSVEVCRYRDRVVALVFPPLGKSPPPRQEVPVGR